MSFLRSSSPHCYNNKAVSFNIPNLIQFSSCVSSETCSHKGFTTRPIGSWCWEDEKKFSRGSACARVFLRSLLIMSSGDFPLPQRCHANCPKLPDSFRSTDTSRNLLRTGWDGLPDGGAHYEVRRRLWRRQLTSCLYHTCAHTPCWLHSHSQTATAFVLSWAIRWSQMYNCGH